MSGGNKKINSGYILLFLAAVIIVVVCLFWVISSQEQNTANLAENEPGSNQLELPTNVDWETHQNEEYGFSFKYPSSYTSHSILWEIHNEGDTLWEWGAHSGQETIISISVYPVNKQADIFQKYGYEASSDKLTLKTGLEVEKLDRNQKESSELIVRKDDIFLIINSAFANLTDTKEYREYQTILNTLEI